MLKALVGFILSIAVGVIAKADIQNGEYYIDNGGVKLWVKVAGQGPACVVQSPGWGPSSDMYINSMKKAESKFTMIYMDSRGSGRSDKPAQIAQYKFQKYVDDLEATRKFFNQDQICLVAHSFATVFATMYAVQHPKNISGLYLIAVQQNIVGDVHNREFEYRVMMRKSEPWFPLFIDAINRNPITDAQFTQQIMDMLPAYFHSVPNMEAAMPYFQGETFTRMTQIRIGTANTKADCDMRPLLAQVQAPTFIFNGINDPWSSIVEGQITHDLVRGSKFIPFENSGHFSWMEEPQKFWSYFGL